jgi:uncharacterized protein (TIGR02145 family)
MKRIYLIVFLLLLLYGCGEKNTKVEQPNSDKDIHNSDKDIQDSKYIDEIQYSYNWTFDHEIRIGGQLWMTENRDVEHYRNGDPIPQVKDSTEWSNLTTGAWCYYNNDPENEKYGKLYNWYAVTDSRGLAPEGWHIPTKEDFELLIWYVGNDGYAMLESGSGKNGRGTNRSGFSALLAGCSFGGWCCYLHEVTYFWSSTVNSKGRVYCLGLFYGDSVIDLSAAWNKNDGFSVRCVKDD